MQQKSSMISGRDDDDDDESHWATTKTASHNLTEQNNQWSKHFQSRLNVPNNGGGVGGVKRFHERYRVKQHLAAGAHGVILWATDRDAPNDEDEDDLKFLNDVMRNKAKSKIHRNKHLAHEYLNRKTGDKGGENGVDDDTGVAEIEHDDECVESENVVRRRQYAVKRIFLRGRTISVSIVREIKVLQYLRGHANVIDLLDVSPSGSSINLVFPLLPTNLTALIYDARRLSSAQCAIYARMLAEGVAYLHRNGVVHRDIKPANLLIDWDGVLKLADFGQSRAIDSGDESELTYQVCTRWYRAPELLYGATRYSYDVDMWSVGCVIGEMIQEWPLFKGETDIEQLSLVVRALGEPLGEWAATLPDFNKIQFVHDREEESRPSGQYAKWLTHVRQQSSPTNRCSDAVIDLLSKLCRYTDRLSADELLRHPFLRVHINDGLLFKAKCIKHLSGPRKINK